MLIAKLFLIFIIVGIKAFQVDNEEVVFCDVGRDNLNSERIDNDKTQEKHRMLLNNKKNNVVRCGNVERKKRNSIKDYMNEACFSGRAVLNENSRQTSLEMKKIENKKRKHHRKKKMKTVTTEKISAGTNAARKFSSSAGGSGQRKRVSAHKSKGSTNKRKVRFISDIERLTPLEPIFKPTKFDELRHGYFNGQVEDYYDSMNDYNVRDKKNIDDKESDIYVFRGQLPQPQFYEDLQFKSTNLTKRDLTDALKNSETQVICNPEKPSVIVDSVAPKSIHRIDRQIVEEIVQVDIPIKMQTTATTCLYTTTQCIVAPICNDLNDPRCQFKDTRSNSDKRKILPEIIIPE